MKILRILIIAAVVAFVLMIGTTVVNHMPKNKGVSTIYSTAGLPEPMVLDKEIYPYSVIPGGVHSVAELKRHMNDDTIRKEFPDFDFAHAKKTTLKEDVFVYVAYKKNGQIFWTRKLQHLSKGEEILTDGHYTIRARCANGISVVPHSTAEPESSDLRTLISQLDTPVMAPSMDIPDFGLGLVPTMSAALPPADYANWGVESFYYGGGYFVNNPNQAQVVTVPEPTDVEYIIFGFGLILVGTLLRKLAQ